MNEEEVDNVTIICVRCNIPAQVPGSIVKKCDICKADVWISPSSQKKKFDKIYCQDCWQLDYNEKKDSLHITKDTIDEFNKWHERKKGYKLQEKDVIEMLEEAIGKKLICEDATVLT